MNDLAVVDRASEFRRLKALVLDSVSSPITRRVYNLGLDEFFAWRGQEPRGRLHEGYRRRLACGHFRGQGSSAQASINVRFTAVPKTGGRSRGQRAPWRLCLKLVR